MPSVVKDSLKTPFRRVIPWLALAAIPAIVALFGVLYAVTFADPYGRMESMSVAVVNLDEGAAGSDGEAVDYGDDLVESILDDDTVAWVEEDAALLDGGLENSDYYVAVVIPDDFSELVAAGETSDPQTAQVVFYKNERKNYLLGMLSSRIETALEEVVNDKISEQYATALAEGLIEAQEGMEDAADGAQSLAEGLEDAVDGSEQISSGAGELSGGTASLVDGLETIADGEESLVDGAEQLSAGAESLQEGTSSLASGLSELSALSSSITEASSLAAEGIGSLSQGSQAFESAVSSSLDEISQETGGDPDAAVAAAQAAYQEALAQYAADVAAAQASGEDPADVGTDDLESALSALMQACAAAGSYEALETVQTSYSGIADGIATLDAQYAQLDSGLASYTSAVDLLASGASELESGASSVSEGTASLLAGASSLSTGTASAITGAETLLSGADELESGADELTEGLVEAADGTDELVEGLVDGAASIADSLTVDAETMGAYVADPVDFEDDIYGEIEAFGTGMAPLFMSLCLWLGALLVFFVFEAFPNRRCLDAGRARAIFGRWPLYLLFSALEVAALLAVTALAGIQVGNPGLLALSFACMAFAFMCIMQFLNLFDVIGKAVAVLLIVCQLAFCGGTLPAFLGSDFAQAASSWLPFTYSVDAVREAISGASPATAVPDLGALLAFAAGAVALSLLLYPAALRMKKRRDAQKVHDITGRTVEQIEADAARA